MIKKIIVSIMMLLVLISSAMAVDVTVGTSGEVVVSDDVIRSNPEPDGDPDELDDENEIEYVVFRIPVEVTNGTANVTDISVDNSAFTYETFDGEVSNIEEVQVVSALPLSITNSTSTVEVRVIVPSNLDTITSTFDQIEHSLPITVSTTEGDQVIDGKFSVENGLTMGDVELIQGDEAYDCDVQNLFDQFLDCDDEIDELVPGEDFYIRFDVDNEFRSSDDLDIEDIEFEIFSDDREVEADDDRFDEDLDSGETIEILMDFLVDEDVEDGETIEITITAYGEDVNGAKHGFKYTFDIEFLVPKYDVRVNSLTLSPSNICQGDETSVAFEIENYGSRSQDNVQILIANDELNIEEVFTRIELEEEDERDNDYNDVYDIQTTPDVQADQYEIEFTVAYEGDGRDTEYVELVERLTIRDCEGDDTDTSQTDNGDTDNTDDTQSDSDVIVVTPTSPTNEQPTTQQPTTDSTNTAAPVTVTAKRSSDVGLVAGLIFAILVLLIVISVIVVVLLRKN